MGTPYKSSNGAVFVQPLGPNTRARYLGCADVDALTEAGGAIDTIMRCLKADGTGWESKGSTVTPPDPVTTTITTWVEGSANWLEQVVQGEAAIYIHQRSGGRADTFGNFDRSWVLEGVRVGERTAESLAMREEDTPSTMGFGIGALPPVYRIFQKTSGRQSIAVTASINDVHFCGVGANLAKVGVAVSDFIAGPGKAQVLYTLDAGATWTATATQPFANSEDIRSVTCFLVGRNTTRIVVARGTTDAGNPMEIGYSDDWGATWNLVNVGSTNGQFAPGFDSLYAYDPYTMWLVAGAGFIYYSEDGGITWSAQESGSLTANDLWAIHFATERIGYAVGEADTILKTEDGGATWTATAASTGVVAILNTVHVLDADNVWVGNASGQMFYTDDGGATWTERAFTGSGAGNVKSIQFVPGSREFGFMVHNTAGPVGSVFWTIDGGFSWEPITLFTNVGINGMYVADANTVFIAGEAQGGTGVIGKVFAKP